MRLAEPEGGITNPLAFPTSTTLRGGESSELQVAVIVAVQ